MAVMEAMISGVPVVGYSTGFNSEWLMNGVGCELVQFGDRFALREALTRVRANWRKYSREARQYADIFDWQPVIDELLGIYQKAHNAPAAKSVSIIIPSHNYERYLPEAIKSAMDQTVPCEVIVIDDKSTDDSVKIAKSFKGVRVIENKDNLEVAETRNKAIHQAAGEFIVCLDADDRLHPQFIEKHLAAFKTNEDAIAYAPVNIIDEHGKNKRQTLFHVAAKPNLQIVGRNQIPSCCMFRRSFWVRAGGYDKRYTPAEDAQLWLKIFSLGGVPNQASDKPLMDYRSHSNSLSAPGFPDWWKSNTPHFNTPIEERDAHITIILDKNDGAKETLWSLENQSYKKWSCILPIMHGLSQTFPWLNHQTHRRGNVLHLKSGVVLPPDFLTEYAKQTPPWTRELRSQ